MPTLIQRCPFCGSARVYVRFYNQPSVSCEDCLSMGPAAQRLTKENKDQCEEEAILRWNKRVDLSHKITLEARDEAKDDALRECVKYLDVDPENVFWPRPELIAKCKRALEMKL